MSDKDKKNSTSFKPGVVTNPSGPDRIPDEYRDNMKEVNELNRYAYKTVLNKYLLCSESELKKAAKNKSTPMIERMVIGVVLHAIQKGDHRRLDALLNRLIGKVKEEIEITGSVNSLLIDIIEKRNGNK